MALHTMKLNPDPFVKIASGKKTVELRLNDAKRQKISVGDTIRFTQNESGEQLDAEVIALHRFRSFAELYRALPLEKCGYAADELAQADPRDMERYYSAEEQASCGVVGIELRCLPPSEKRK